MPQISPLYQHNQTIRNMLDAGATKREIAQTIGCVESTLKSHIKSGYHLNDTFVAQKAVPVVECQSVGRVWWDRGNKILHDDGTRMDLEFMPDTVMLFGDMQAPLHHEDSVAFLAAVKARYEPDFCVCMGDEADLTFLKKHMLGADSFGPTHELDAAKEYMREIFKLFPRAICLTSNHVQQRIGYAQAQANFPTPFIRQWAEVVGAPNTWIWRDYLIMGNNLFEHGHLINKGARGSIQQQTVQRFGRTLSVYRGHHHSELGDHMKPIWVEGGWQQRIVFTGCLMDPRKVSYSRGAIANGCVVIVKGTPHAIPMMLNKSGRWIGKLVD